MHGAVERRAMGAMLLLAVIACGESENAADTGGADLGARPETKSDAIAQADAPTEVQSGAVSQIDAGDEAPETIAAPPFPLGFVTVLTGKVVVVDRIALQPKATFGGGHTHTHGVGVMPNQQVVWYGNVDETALDRYESVGGNTEKWKLVRSKKAPVPFQFIDTSTDGKVLGLAPDVLEHNPGDQPKPRKHVLFFDTSAETYSTLELLKPTVLALDATGGTAYVADNATQSVHVVDTKLAKPVAEWAWPPSPVASPMKFLSGIELSPDGKTLALCTSGGMTLALYDTHKPGPPRLTTFPFMPYWVAFSPDSQFVYVTTSQGMIVEGDEKKNAAIPTTLEKVEVVTGKAVKSVKWKYALSRVAMPITGNVVYVTASFGMMLGYDADTLELKSETPVEPALPTPAMTISF
jgi:sugar lactone lactonase YvrE